MLIWLSTLNSPIAQYMQYIQGYWAGKLQTTTPWCHWHRCDRMLPWILHPYICSGLPERREVCTVLSQSDGGENWPPLSGRSTWTTAFAKPFHTTWKTSLWPWWCMISCVNMEFTFRSGWKEALSSLCPAPWNFEPALASFIYMAIKIHAYPDIHPAISLEQSRWTEKSLKPCGHHSTTSHGASVGCLWFIDRRYWMHTWTIPIGRSWFTLVCGIYISQVCNVDDSIHLPVPSLLRRWKRLETGMDQSAETFQALSERFKSNRKRWLKAERKAQLKRSEDCTVMDIYDTATTKRMSFDNSSYVFC